MSCCFESSTPLKTLIDFRMILMKLGTGHPLNFSHSIGINANTWLFRVENCIYSIFTTFAWRPFSGTDGNVQVSRCSPVTWGEHVQAICSKARKILGLLYRRFYNNTPISTLLQLYISLVRPHLDYASAIWSPYLSKDKIELENIQKFACRMAPGLWDSSYYQDLLELVDLPTLECQRLETRLCLLYKIIYKLCYFNLNTFTVSTFLSHHAPHNL